MNPEQMTPSESVLILYIVFKGEIKEERRDD